MPPPSGSPSSRRVRNPRRTPDRASRGQDARPRAASAADDTDQHGPPGGRLGGRRHLLGQPRLPVRQQADLLGADLDGERDRSRRRRPRRSPGRRPAAVAARRGPIRRRRSAPTTTNAASRQPTRAPAASAATWTSTSAAAAIRNRSSSRSASAVTMRTSADRASPSLRRGLRCAPGPFARKAWTRICGQLGLSGRRLGCGSRSRRGDPRPGGVRGSPNGPAPGG